MLFAQSKHGKKKFYFKLLPTQKFHEIFLEPLKVVPPSMSQYTLYTASINAHSFLSADSAPALVPEIKRTSSAPCL